MRPTPRLVWAKAIAISTGMNVPEVLIPTMILRKTTMRTPIGRSRICLNIDCSSIGSESTEKLRSSVWANLLWMAVFTETWFSIMEK